MNRITSMGQTMAVLAASGLNENDLTQTQKALQKSGIKMTIISPDQGLLSSWNGDGWGLSFAVDVALNQALAADYDALLIPGGSRSVEKLKTTAHTRRFTNGFLDNGKPVIAIDEAAGILAFSGKLTGRTLAAPQSLKTAIENVGANASGGFVEIDGNLMTIAREQEPDAIITSMITDFVEAHLALKKAA